MPKSSQLFLVDAHALCYRSYYAIKGLRNSQGQATNAVYGFVSTLRKILRDFQPKYMAICFDKEGKTNRQKKFVEYKIQRPAMPDDLISQIPLIKQVVETYHLPVFEMSGFEADDIIATLTKKFSAQDLDVVIVSDDKDMFQLVNDHVKIFSPRQDKLFDYTALKKDLGFDPGLVSDFLALAGDAVDNIPGVKGIGEVTARNLVSQYGSLETILQHVDDLTPPRVKERVMQDKQMAMLSKELALLEADVPIDLSLSSMEVREPDNEKLFALFSQLEFRKFAEELAPLVSARRKVNCQRLFSAAEVEKLLSRIHREKCFAFLSDPAAPVDEELLLQARRFFVVPAAGEVYEIPLEHVALLQPVLTSEAVAKVTYDVKAQWKFLQPFDCSLQGKIFDVMLAGYLLSPGKSSYDLPSLSWEYLQATIPSENSRSQEAALVFDIYPLMEARLKERDLFPLFNDIEIPLSYVLFRMEAEGVKIDEDLLVGLARECEKKIQALNKDLFEMAGEEFNLNSPKQLSHILFEKLKLPAVKKTKTGFSTDESVLVRLAQKHKFPGLLLEYRQLAKLKSTYIDALPRLKDPQTGKIHAHFNQTGAETGRLSSNDPNLQNIPIRAELGRQIRKAFIPAKKGNVLLTADYSQIELRILAHLTKDTGLMEAFSKDQDIHKHTAAQVFDVPEKDVTAGMRDTAKRVNFGIIYGMSAFGLAKDLDISQEEAQAFIERYFSRYPGVKKFMDEVIKKCRQLGYVTTLLNRRRYIPDINNPNIAIRQFAERQAINTPVQGSAADLMKLAMIQIQGDLEKKNWDARMIITVHDELVFDVPKEEAADLAALVRQRMESALRLDVPVKVTVKRGANWLDLEQLD